MKRKFDEMMNDSSLDELLNKKHMKDKSSQKGDMCPICMENFCTTNITITKCGNKFCHTCLDEHSCGNNKCPLCRKNMDTKIKNNICNCHIRKSVNKALTDSNHHLNNLCKRLIKKLFKMMHENKTEFETIINDINNINEHNVISNQNQINTNNEENDISQTNINENNSSNNFNYLICKVIRKLNEIDNFKDNLYKYFYEEIFYFTLINSNHTCMNLKSLIEKCEDHH